MSEFSWYIYDGKAYRWDSIGNITWGAIMKSYEWPEGISKKAAGAYQTYEDISNSRFDLWKLLSNLSNYGDDPRDTAAIGLGYDF